MAVIPFCASTRRYAGWIAGDDLATNLRDGRELARCIIAAPDGGDLTLSVPVAGGAHALRSRDAIHAEHLLSDHGKWRSEHLGAWQASYGRTPYFIHIFPEIETAYQRSQTQGYTLSMLADDMHSIVLRWIEETRDVQLTPAAAQRCAELATKLNTDLSIFDALFRFGKETGLALRAAKL